MKYFNDAEKTTLIQKNLDKFFSENDGTKYAYTILDKANPKRISIINNHQEWFALYIQNDYQFIDPVIVRALSCVSDFSWDENILTPGNHSLPRIFRESGKHNIVSGHTFVLHDYLGNLALLSIMQNKSCSFDLSACREKLYVFFTDLHQKVLGMYALQPSTDNNKDLLTERECQVLYWAGTGKSYAEIALILSVSERTIKFHMGNAVKKLGVSNARHAIKLSIELNLIERVIHSVKSDNLSAEN